MRATWTSGKNGTNYGGKIEIESDIYEWYLHDADYRFGIIQENLEATNPTPGLNGTTFRIKIDIPYYRNPDVLALQHPDYPIEIVEGGIPDGAGTVYVCRLQSDRPGEFIPPYLLEPGKTVAKVSTSVVSEMNGIFGTQEAQGAMKLRSQIGKFGEEFTITDKAWRMQGMLGIQFSYTNKEGSLQKVESYLPYAESQLNEKFYSDIEWALWYGKKSTRTGYNGYVKRTGPGLREQLKESWLKPLNGPITETTLKNYLLDIFFSRTDEMDRKVVAFTGSIGRLQFHDALAAKAASFFTLDTNWIEQVSKNPRHMSFGAEFTHYLN